MPIPQIPSLPTTFPTYLVPFSPFRRRKSSTDSNASTSSSTTTGSEGTAFCAQEDTSLSGNASHLRCARCAADLALSSQIISKGFTGRHGRAYLVAPSACSPTGSPAGPATLKARNDALPDLPNTNTHKPVPRQLVTGAHTVGDISCAHCGSVLGWKYVAAEEEAQRYKVGKFILETKRVCRTSTWEGDDGFVVLDGGNRRSSLGPPRAMPKMPELDEAEFDSQDEDECYDLFAGRDWREGRMRRRTEASWKGRDTT